MIISITQQIQCIVFNIIAGIIIGMLFDVYRMIRGYDDRNKFVSVLEDLLFWILTAIIVFTFLFITDYIYIGAYVYMLMIIGICMYVKLFSTYFVKLQYKFFKILIKSFRVLKNTIIYPFTFIIYNIKIKIKKNYKK